MLGLLEGGDYLSHPEVAERRDDVPARHPVRELAPGPAEALPPEPLPVELSVLGVNETFVSSGLARREALAQVGALRERPVVAVMRPDVHGVRRAARERDQLRGLPHVVEHARGVDEVEPARALAQVLDEVA